MKQFMLVCLVSMLSVFFTACESGEEEDTDTNKEVLTVHGSSMEGAVSVELSAGGCVLLRDNEKNNVVVKKATQILCTQINYDGCEGDACSKKCIADSLMMEEDFKWSASGKNLKKASTVPDEGCASLEYKVPGAKTGGGDQSGGQAQAQDGGTSPQTQDGAGGGATPATPAAADAQGDGSNPSPESASGTDDDGQSPTNNQEGAGGSPDGGGGQPTS